MTRLEKFRDDRRSRKRYKLFIFILFFILTSGICVADYSVNTLISNDRSIKIVSIQNINNSFLKISLLNHKIYVNIIYLNRDYNRIKSTINKFIAGVS
jgi:hypothetical protein